MAVAAVLLVGLFTAFGSDRPDSLGWDFRATYYPAGDAVLHGESPYEASIVPGGVREYVYPPQLALLVAPLAALPIDVASVIAVVACFAALMGALALVGVRDLRCYAALVAWGPAWNTLELAQVSALLTLLLALAWRFRSTSWPLAASLGALVSLKLFLWPVLVWCVATRRVGAALLALALGIGLTAASWGTIGFAGLRGYPALLERVAEQESYSMKSMSAALGLGPYAGYVVTAAVAATLLVACVQLARSGDDARAFLVAILAALAVSPVVWIHYVVLLAVPVGILRPRFTPLWLLPVVLWVAPRAGNGEGIEPFLVALVVAAMGASLLASPRPRAAVSPA